MIKIGELQDEEHLKSILSCLAIGSGMRILEIKTRYLIQFNVA